MNLQKFDTYASIFADLYSAAKILFTFDYLPKDPMPVRDIDCARVSLIHILQNIAHIASDTWTNPIYWREIAEHANFVANFLEQKKEECQKS